MGYRTLEISTSCEIHIKEGQLEVTSDAGVALIPIEDLSQIMVHGANIRLSTMDLWLQIINQKVSNQSRALSIMGMKGEENISKYLESMTTENVDITEALAAKEYFSYYHEGLNRRGDDPINSRLNYGYTVIRSSIARSLVAAGFHPTFGIHHDSQLNA